MVPGKVSINILWKGFLAKGKGILDIFAFGIKLILQGVLNTPLVESLNRVSLQIWASDPKSKSLTGTYPSLAWKVSISLVATLFLRVFVCEFDCISWMPSWVFVVTSSSSASPSTVGRTTVLLSQSSHGLFLGHEGEKRHRRWTLSGRPQNRGVLLREWKRRNSWGYCKKPWQRKDVDWDLRPSMKMTFFKVKVLDFPVLVVMFNFTSPLRVPLTTKPSAIVTATLQDWALVRSCLSFVKCFVAPESNPQLMILFPSVGVEGKFEVEGVGVRACKARNSSLT